MRTIKPKRIDNSLVLEKLKDSAVCLPYLPEIRAAYIRYVRNRGRPDKVKSLGLPDEVAAELYSLYRSKAKKNNLAWITEYRAAKRFSHCPLCGNPGPAHLEHYLPRAPYSEFTLLSWNLLPSCGLCNGKRGNHANGEGQKVPLIHPYFDSKLFDQPILTALISRPFEAVMFTPMPRGNVHVTIKERVARQIETCVNMDRFDSHLVGMWNIWRRKSFEYPDISLLVDAFSLELRAATGAISANSWDAAFYRAMLADETALQWLVDNPLRA